MKLATLLSILAIFVVWLSWNVWNVFRITAGLRSASHRRPLWWMRVFSVVLFADFSIWAWGMSRGGLDIEEACAFVHHQRYDEDYWNSHAEDFQKFFPLHNKCNENYDMVPAWVNPAIVVLTLLATICLCAVVYLLVRDRARNRKARLLGTGQERQWMACARRCPRAPSGGRGQSHHPHCRG